MQMPNVCQSITLNMALFTVRIEFSARRLKRGQLHWGLGKFSNSGFQIGKYDKSVHKNIIRPKCKGETEYKECANNIDTCPIPWVTHTLHKNTMPHCKTISFIFFRCNNHQCKINARGLWQKEDGG